MGKRNHGDASAGPHHGLVERSRFGSARGATAIEHSFLVLLVVGAITLGSSLIGGKTSETLGCVGSAFRYKEACVLGMQVTNPAAIAYGRCADPYTRCARRRPADDRAAKGPTARREQRAAGPRRADRRERDGVRGTAGGPIGIKL